MYRMKKTKIFREFFISYVIVMLVPMIILGGFINTVARNSIKNASLRIVQNKIDRITEIYDEYFLNKQVMSNNWYANRNFTYKNVSSDLTSLQNVYSFLKNCMVEDDAIEAVVYYYGEEDFVVSPASTFKPEELNEYLVTFPDEVWESMLDRIKNSESSVIFPQQDTNGYDQVITCVLHAGNTSTDGNKAVFFINSKRLFEKVETIAEEYMDNIFLFSGDKLVGCQDDYDTYKEMTFSDVMQMDNKMIIDDEVLLGNIKVVFSVPKNKIYAELYRLNYMLLAILVFLLVAGFILITMLSQKKSKPILSIGDKVTAALKKKTDVDTWEDISIGLDSICIRLSSLDNLAEGLKPYARRQILKDIVVGDGYNSMSNTSLDAFLFEDEIYAAVFAENIKKNSSEQLKAALELELNEIGVDIYFLDNRANNLIGILSAAVDVDTMAVEKLIKKMTYDGYEIRVGKFYRGVENITKSYVEVNSQVGGEMQIGYPYNKIKEFNRAVANKKFSECNNIIRDIFTEYGNEMPMFFMKCLAMDILLIYINGINDSTPISPFVISKYIQEINKIHETCSYKELEDILMECCESIQNDLLAQNDEIKMLVEKIKDYTDKNCLSSQFSLKELSGKFESSTSYIGTLFKTYFGCTISSYIWNRRLEKAKELLKETELTINEISGQVGYEIPNSFIRKFKDSEGVTPNEYRNQNNG